MLRYFWFYCWNSKHSSFYQQFYWRYSSCVEVCLEFFCSLIANLSIALFCSFRFSPFSGKWNDNKRICKAIKRMSANSESAERAKWTKSKCTWKCCSEVSGSKPKRLGNPKPKESPKWSQLNGNYLWNLWRANKPKCTETKGKSVKVRPTNSEVTKQWADWPQCRRRGSSRKKVEWTIVFWTSNDRSRKDSGRSKKGRKCTQKWLHSQKGPKVLSRWRDHSST